MGLEREQVSLSLNKMNRNLDFNKPIVVQILSAIYKISYYHAWFIPQYQFTAVLPLISPYQITFFASMYQDDICRNITNNQ